MATPFIGEIKYFGGNFAPRSFAQCSGQLLSIAQNTALFSILGTTYGGNGQTTFALPDLRGRVPVGPGQGPGLQNYSLGEIAGSETVSLLTTNLPAHVHPLTAGTAGSTASGTLGAATAKGTTQTPAAGSVLAKAADSNGVAVPLIYAPAGTAIGAQLAGVNLAGSTGAVGNNIPVSILQPYLVIFPLIAIEGIFPSRN